MEEFVKYLLITAIIFDATISWLVLLKNYKKAVHQAYFIMISSITVWQISHFLRSYYPLQSEKSILFVNQLTLASVAIVLAAFLYFVIIYPNKKHKERERLWCAVIASILVIISFTPWTIQIETIKQATPITFGSLYPFLVFALLLLLVTALSVFVFRWVQSQDVRTRIQFQYLALGITVPIIFGGFNSLYLPYLAYAHGAGTYFMNTINTIGPASTIFLSAATGYSILRYRLMDIKVLINRNLVITFVLLVLVMLFALVLKLAEQFIGIDFSVLEIVVLAIIAAAFLFLTPLSFLHFLIRKIMRRGQFDLRLWNEKEKDFLSRAESPEKISCHLASDFLRQIPVEHFILLSYDHYQNCLRTCYPTDGWEKKFALDEPWVKAVTENARLWSKEELHNKFPHKARRGIEKTMKEFRSEYVMPLFIYDRLVGVVFIGKRVDGTPFSKKDKIYIKKFQTSSSNILWSVLQLHHVVRSHLDNFS